MMNQEVLPRWVSDGGTSRRQPWVPSETREGMHVQAVVGACLMEIPAALDDYWELVEVARGPFQQLLEKTRRDTKAVITFLNGAERWLKRGKVPMEFAPLERGLEPMVEHCQRFADRYLGRSEVGKGVVVGLVEIDALDVDLKTLERERWNTTELHLVYGVQTPRADQRRQREIKKTMRERDWKRLNLAYLLEPAKVWVWRENLFGGSHIKALRRYFKDPLFSSADDRYYQWWARLKEFDRALQIR